MIAWSLHWSPRMASYETLKLDNKDGVAIITLDRPTKRNAMNPKLHQEMVEVLTEST